MHAKPDDIPQDVWDAAEAVDANFFTGHRGLYVLDVARAIMAAEERATLAERERCAKVAESPRTFMHFDGDFEGNHIADAAAVEINEKQIVQVLNAVNAGCETSNQVAAYTGLSIAKSSVYLGNLTDDGLIRIVARDARSYTDKGRKSHVYAAIRKGAQ